MQTQQAQVRTHQGTTQFTTHLHLTERALPDDHASWYGAFSVPHFPTLKLDDILDLELADGRRGQAVVHRVLVANSAQRVQFLGIEQLK